MTSRHAIDEQVTASAESHDEWSRTPREARAAALMSMASALEAEANSLIVLAIDETHLSESRLRAELQRTTFQLRLLAEEVISGAYLDARIDETDPDWRMGARPDIRRTQLPVGPVLVFAASNFPFAFSVAGGDSASALAAGCSVIVKAHPGHPQLSDATWRVVTKSLSMTGAPDTVFQIVHGDEAGANALRHPLVKAACFTGSLKVGRMLFDVAARRAEPIPFYGELGSVNPVFVTPAADSARPAEIAEGLLSSFTLGMGQFCTKPGLVLVPSGSRVLGALTELDLPSPGPMLNARIADQYEEGLAALRATTGVSVVSESHRADRAEGAPTVLRTTASHLLATPDLLSECFGPAVLVAEYTDVAEMLEVAACLDGQLTASVHAEDYAFPVRKLLRTLEVKVGRLLWNQWPTGVSVTHAQHHGGPYPASTAPAATSVGTAAISRFLRPVAYQGMPEELLPDELRRGSGVPQRLNGQLPTPG